jgi:hypothetical protein
MSRPPSTELNVSDTCATIGGHLINKTSGLHQSRHDMDGIFDDGCMQRHQAVGLDVHRVREVLSTQSECQEIHACQKRPTLASSSTASAYACARSGLYEEMAIINGDSPLLLTANASRP